MNTSSYLFVRLPLELLKEQRLNSNEKILWCFLNDFAWPYDQTGRRRPPSVNSLQEELDTGQRSIYRWLKKLQATGWMSWEKYADRSERLTPLTPEDRQRTPTVDVIATAQQIIEKEDVSIDELKAVIQAILPLILSVSPESDVPPESESVPPVANILPSESDVSPESDVPSESHVPPVANILPSESDNLPPESESVPPRSDNLIVGSILAPPDPLSEQTDAPPKTHETHETLLDDSDNSAVAAFLAEHGVIEVEEFRQLPLEAIKERVANIKRNPQWRPSDIVRSLRKTPIPSEPPLISSEETLLSSEDAQQRVKASAPEDATEEEIADMIEEVQLGASIEQALDRLYYQRYWSQRETTTTKE